MTFREFCRALVLPVALIFLLSAGPLPAAQAAMVTTDQVVADARAADDRAAVKAFMQREDVREQMRALGVDPGEADARVAALSDAEVARIAGELEQAEAGQGALGAVIGAAVVIFIVLLITDILCFTSVFNFTRCAR